MYVRDWLSYQVDARGDGTHTLQQSTTLKADTMRASDRMDSCDILAVLQILQTSVRAPQNTQTAAEVHSLVAVDADEHEIAQRSSRVLRNSRLPTRVMQAAEPGPSGWRNADIAAIGRSAGGPAVPREWIGTWTRAPLDCGPKKPWQQMPQPCPRKLRSIALAGVLMKLAESCVIEQQTH